MYHLLDKEIICVYLFLYDIYYVGSVVTDAWCLAQHRLIIQMSPGVHGLNQSLMTMGPATLTGSKDVIITIYTKSVLWMLMAWCISSGDTSGHKADYLCSRVPL